MNTIYINELPETSHSVSGSYPGTPETHYHKATCPACEREKVLSDTITSESGTMAAYVCEDCPELYALCECGAVINYGESRCRECYEINEQE